MSHLKAGSREVWRQARVPATNREVRPAVVSHLQVVYQAGCQERGTRRTRSSPLLSIPQTRSMPEFSSVQWKNKNATSIEAVARRRSCSPTRSGGLLPSFLESRSYADQLVLRPGCAPLSRRRKTSTGDIYKDADQSYTEINPRLPTVARSLHAG